MREKVNELLSIMTVMVYSYFIPNLNKTYLHEEGKLLVSSVTIVSCDHVIFSSSLD